MKQLFFTTLIAAVAVAASSCKKDSNPSATGTGATVTAERYGFDGGNAGKFTSTQAGIIQTSLGGVSNFSISAIRDGGKESITIIVLKPITSTGVIQLGSDLDNGGIVIMKDYTNPSDLTQRYSTDNDGVTTTGGGEINITKLNGDNVEGTFYAVAYNSTGKEAFAEQGSFKGKITH